MFFIPSAEQSAMRKSLGGCADIYTNFFLTSIPLNSVF